MDHLQERLEQGVLSESKYPKDIIYVPGVCRCTLVSKQKVDVVSDAHLRGQSNRTQYNTENPASPRWSCRVSNLGCLAFALVIAEMLMLTALVYLLPKKAL